MRWRNAQLLHPDDCLGGLDKTGYRLLRLLRNIQTIHGVSSIRVHVDMYMYLTHVEIKLLGYQTLVQYYSHRLPPPIHIGITGIYMHLDRLC